MRNLKTYMTPVYSLRFVVLFCLYGYWQIAQADTASSVTTFYGALYPPFGAFLRILYPHMFFVGGIVVIAFSRHLPYLAILVGASPQFFYTALAAGWYAGSLYMGDVLNPAIFWEPLIITMFIITIAWRQVDGLPHEPIPAAVPHTD